MMRKPSAAYRHGTMKLDKGRECGRGDMRPDSAAGDGILVRPRLMRFRHRYPARFTIICSKFRNAAEFGDGARKAPKSTATWARWC